MKVAVSTIGKFHCFDLARELHVRGALAGIFTGYPRFKLSREQLPSHMVHTFPWLHTPYMAMANRELLGHRIVRAWEYLDSVMHDEWVARQLPPCDVFVGLSSSALRSGRAAKQRGAKYVCDRGSSHIRVQDRLLREEHERWGMPFAGIDPRVIAREEAEYAEADLISVPSTFALNSFVSQGFLGNKVRRLPYGVDLARFSPTGAPASDRFDVLFVGSMTLQKGVPYLLQAYKKLHHPRKSLSFAGSLSPRLVQHFRDASLWPDDAILLGHVPQLRLKNLMSRSHVLVLPSIQEGLALVQAQAMACGCPVIGTHHTGGEDLFTDGKEGFIVPIRNADVLAERMQQLADQPNLRAQMGQQALARVRSIGGWRDYGDQALALYRGLSR